MSKSKNLSLVKKVAELYNSGMCLQEIAAYMNIRGNSLTGYFMEAHSRNLLQFDANRSVGAIFGQSLNEELCKMLGIENRKEAILLLDRHANGVLVRLSPVSKTAKSASLEDVDSHIPDSDAEAAEGEVDSHIVESDPHVAEEDFE